MKRIISFALAFIVIVSVITTPTIFASSEQILTDSNDYISTEEKILTTVNINDDFKDDEIIVALNNSESLKLNEYTAADFSEISVKSVENLTKPTDEILKVQREAESITVQSIDSGSTADENGIYINEDKYHQLFLLKLSKSGKENVIKCIKLLEQRDDVILAMPNYIDVIEPLEGNTATTDEIVASTYATTKTPNDYTNLTGQWGIGQIDLPEAWSITTGSNSVIVGVVDTGIKGDHEDLSANIATSSYHQNFTGDGTSALTDQNGHGTKAAGVIAAVGNNGKGTVGACWNIKLASLKVFTYDSEAEKYTTSADIFADAIVFAKSKGITILNYSAGGGSESSKVLNALLDYNGLFVCPAGNNGEDISVKNYYPASYDTDNMIVVAGTDTDDALYTGYTTVSNYSKTTVDLGAPGQNIYTTSNSGSYISDTGTSLAAPYVTGVAALLKSKYPAMGAEAIKWYITHYVDKITALDGKVATGGRLNAYKALSNVRQYTVKYDANGGTGTMADTTVIYKNRTPLRKNAFTNNGAEFLGWYARRSSDSKWYYTNGSSSGWYVEGQEPDGYYKYLYVDERGVIDTSSVDGDIVIMYAQWKIMYTVSFNGCTGVGSMPDISAQYGVEYTLPSNQFTKEGYYLEYWYAKKSTGETYCVGAHGSGWYPIKEKPTDYVRKSFSDEQYIYDVTMTDIVNGDVITMYAHWEPLNYELGDVDMDKKVTINDAILIQKYTAGIVETLTTEQLYIADVDYSGSVDINDASQIQKYVAGTLEYWDE
ncbi:MAG: S8 family serine peptidase [Ruminococcus sp.]|nr:S8 family serine peptidase [Ruminococcus sp.]